jgi:signal transduction histidine kinase
MMTRRAYHAVFGVALLALFALGISWTAFIWRAMGIERELSLERLAVAVHRAAEECGRSVKPWPLGPLPDGALEVVPAGVALRTPPELVVPCTPLHAARVVRPSPAVLDGVERKLMRRRVQAWGESGTLLVLLGTCTVMLYRLVRSERRGAARMREFLATVTHEMKTPLTGIKSLLQTIAAGRVSPEDCPLLVGLGLKETERLEHMVDNVLMSGRLRADALQIHLEDVPLEEQVVAFLDHRHRYMVGREDRLRLRWEADEGNIVVRADANAVRIIMENLTDNAFKYGGNDPIVDVVVARREDRAQVSVEDHGIGFSPEEAATLFAPFWRTAGEHGGQHGTGLGLSLSLALARHMGGELAAASEGPGRGARFTLTLPVVIS